mmetsp:Transcript_8104/g.8257  ORF Transcript_8104/g.8257 Transcript_8104/m.8257 type:complete len:179 (-) Transcript_8104:111-647(-)|eukprot:CAMPEP_0182428546 /NCGR_PEP_ID=MMETSP1167-20130531/23103_1 /TAXON_ID=2988 /ORGANISM="Mallomonas Sp, Strain CCMP3275" /LENGTH=178 /DNA_ID=CAMNT_0024611505 /DNA_START=60 /DNA_END=596 /DNA_ORIENTATION=-
MYKIALFFISVLSMVDAATSFKYSGGPALVMHRRLNERSVKILAAKDDPSLDPEEATKKYGLEIGLFKAFTSKDGEKSVRPQDLLAKYGASYLITSITLAIISYSICYVLVSNGIDVASLLEKVNIKTTSASNTAGTAAIAYAVHKAASPIRFPPTVALTPVVANILGKSKDKDNESS